MRHAAIWILVAVLSVAAAADEPSPAADGAPPGPEGGPPGQEDGPAGQDGGPPGGGGMPAMPPATVETTGVIQRNIAAGRTFVGTVEPVRRSVVGSEFPGLVVQYDVREGDRVEPRQPLATLRTVLLDLQIEAAQAEREGRRQGLLELRNGSRPEEVQQAQARVDQLEADLAFRKWKLEALKRLHADNTVSEDELRDARMAERDAELVLAAARASFALVEAGPRAERIAQAEADVKRQDAEVKRLEEQKERAVIRAPFAGWVVKEHTQVGQWLATGSPVAELVALDEVDVTVDVVEDVVGHLAEGLPVRVHIAAASNRIFTGTIHRIVPSADRRGRTFPVRVRLTNERRGGSVLLKAGMFATATLGVGEERPALLVPKDAVVLGGPVPALVWAVGKGNRAEMIPVTLGVAVDDLIEVMGPLQPDMRIVVRGNERIYMPGRQLQIVGE